eukprot:2878921-Rhodomonas_salina.2
MAGVCQGGSGLGKTLGNANATEVARCLASVVEGGGAWRVEGGGVQEVAQAVLEWMLCGEEGEGARETRLREEEEASGDGGEREARARTEEEHSDAAAITSAADKIRPVLVCLKVLIEGQRPSTVILEKVLGLATAGLQELGQSSRSKEGAVGWKKADVLQLVEASTLVLTQVARGSAEQGVDQSVLVAFGTAAGMWIEEVWSVVRGGAGSEARGANARGARRGGGGEEGEEEEEEEEEEEGERGSLRWSEVRGRFARVLGSSERVEGLKRAGLGMGGGAIGVGIGERMVRLLVVRLGQVLPQVSAWLAGQSLILSLGESGCV